MKSEIREQDCFVRLDPRKMNHLRTMKGWSRARFSSETGLHQRTVTRLFGGESVRIDSAKAAINALGLDSMESVLLEAEASYEPHPELGEWAPEKALSKWLTASNGLQYQIHLLTHRIMPKTFGRGKCYDLAPLADSERMRLRDHLIRHPQVCRRLQPHPHLPVNERVFHVKNQKQWWVIDQWVPGLTLADVLKKGPLAKEMLPRVLREIALALKSLHEAEIVRRELSPSYIVLREADGSVLLTDFELSKLLDGSPTVSDDWPVDPYRAPEVGPDGVDQRADIYSWGRIFIHTALGELPEKGCEGSALIEMNLPKNVESLVRQCVALPRSKRPGSVDEILVRMAGYK